MTPSTSRSPILAQHLEILREEAADQRLPPRARESAKKTIAAIEAELAFMKRFQPN